MAASKQIVPGVVPPASQKPVLVKQTPKVKYWAFSFRFWKQEDYFGLGDSNNKWFVSLLERLQQMSNEVIDNSISDPAAAQAMRWHPINWNGTNVPINSELDWVAEKYSKNQVEFPVYQFQISMGTGRVVGFFDEASIFNIILLDPKHNLQPSRDYGYRVDKTTIGLSEISSLLNIIDEQRCQCIDCANTGDLQNIFQKELWSYTGGAILLHWNEEQRNRFIKVVSGGTINDISDLFEYALDIHDCEFSEDN